MSLELAINNALTGLNVNQRALSVVSQNIANATTEGYTRKTIDQSAIYIGKEQLGSGVKIDDVVRKIDVYLQRSTRAQTSVSAKSGNTDEYMGRIQTLLGQPGRDNALNQYMDGFFNAMQSLAQTPERISFREIATDSGANLAREISSLALSLENLRAQADNDIATAVTNLNADLASLDKVNVAITNASVLGNPISGLQDEQDKLIKNISQMVDVKVLIQPSSNEAYIYTANGIPLLDDSAYELSYTQPYSVESFIDDNPFSPVEIYRLNNKGVRQNPPEILVSGGKSSQVQTPLENGQLKSLLELRDKDIPQMLEQLDEMAQVLRDSMNAINNAGSSFPPPNELTGTREVSAFDAYNWSGKIMVAALDKNGQPIPSPYANESKTGIRPLTLDLATLDSGTGAGQPTIQGIIDEINHHFNPPTTKVNLGNLSNIQLVSNNDRLPNTGLDFNFDFELENIAKSGSEFFVTNVAITDSLGAAVIPANFTTTRPNFTVQQFTTTNNSAVVNVTTTVPHNLKNGDYIFLEQPAAAVNGINAAALSSYFQISNVTSSGFDITASQIATATGPVANGVVRIFPPYDEIDAGETSRTKSAGTITADLSGASGSAYYDIQVSVGVRPTDGADLSAVKTSIVTFRVPNNTLSLRNDRFDNIAATGDGVRDIPTNINPQLRAIMVDSDGKELPRDAYGNYYDEKGFLKIVGNGENTVAIEELDSKQLGITTTTPVTAGTNRAFSHFFELNNLFESNKPTATGDTRKNSAINFKLEDRIENNSNLISVGNLERSNQPSNPNDAPIYTYQRNSGNNQTVQKLAKLSTTIQDFNAAGGLSNSRQTISGYMGEVLAFFATNAASSTQKAKDDQILLEGFQTRLDSVVKVNVDEELANMVLFQNAYTASARVISTSNQMFDTLLQAVQ